MITKHIKDYCCEDISHIENYAQAVADQEQVWDCHHRRETIYTREGLKEIGEYYHRPAAELIFLPHEKHISLHKAGARNHMYGKHHSKAAKEKISTSSKKIFAVKNNNSKQNKKNKLKIEISSSNKTSIFYRKHLSNKNIINNNNKYLISVHHLNHKNDKNY